MNDITATQAEKVHLTPRELDILRLVGAGKTNAQIGKELYICKRTVRSHLENIMEKMKVHSRTEAVILALKWELINL